ncbi:MAG: group 1 truncated hemoglobin [Myxococcota bacterium]|nr:group 1 truncated hemoglobin [Myxococcota bacterium]
MSDYEALGGEPGLRAIVNDFIDREAGDFIVGFFFEGHDLARIKEMEFQLASAHLGGPHRYTGRGMGSTHAPHPINAGHFRRRLAILRTVLREHGADEAIIERWLDHDRRLESLVTNGQECAQ